MTNPAASGDAASMNDEEYVAAFEKRLRSLRARLAEFNADLERRIGQLGPISDEVQARFGADGYLEDLWIAPTALTGYTALELEDLITEVLRASTEQVRAVLAEVYDQHMGPESAVSELLR